MTRQAVWVGMPSALCDVERFVRDSLVNSTASHHVLAGFGDNMEPVMSFVRVDSAECVSAIASLLDLDEASLVTTTLFEASH